MTTEVGIARKQAILLVKETTRGTLKYPDTDDSAVVTIASGYGNMNQNPNFSNSNEIRNSRDVLTRFVDARPAGKWDFSTYMRPSGVAGDIPQDSVLYECFFGVETITGGTSVAYTQALGKPSFSMFMKKDHTVFFAKGCTVSQLNPSVTNAGGVDQKWSGGLMWLGICGTDSLTAIAAQDATTIEVADAKKYSVGAWIKNSTKDDDNTGDGYKVTAVDVDADELELDSGVDEAGGWEADDVIEPFLPDSTEVGATLANRLTTVDFGADTGKKVQSANLTLNDPINYIEDEISADGYPTSYLEDVRDLSGNVDMYFRQDDAKYFYEGFNDTKIDVSINFGDTAGSQAELNMPQTSIEVPTVSTNAPAVNLSIGIMALGDDGEDSCSLEFT